MWLHAVDLVHSRHAELVSKRYSMRQVGGEIRPTCYDEKQPTFTETHTLENSKSSRITRLVQQLPDLSD